MSKTDQTAKGSAGMSGCNPAHCRVRPKVTTNVESIIPAIHRPE